MAVDIDQSHYNTGTAAVAGTAVTGTGTAWLGAVRKGDLYGTHKGSGVRIASVNSNTSITLAYAVAALEQANGPYEIQRTPYDVGYLKAIEDMITLYGVGNLPSLAALSGLGGNKGIGLDGIGSAFTYALTAFARTLLDDADAATMRGTLDVAQKQSNTTDSSAGRGMIVGAFGVGAAAQTAITTGTWNDLVRGGMYYVSSLVTGGPAAGAFNALVIGESASGGRSMQIASQIGAGGKNVWFRRCDDGVWSSWTRLDVQYGSNANGEFIRFGDGTQYCWRSITLTGLTPATASTEGSMVSGRYVNQLTNAFAAAFVAPPMVFPNSRNATSGGSGRIFQDTYVISTTATNFAYRITAAAVFDGAITDFFAVGRWY